MTNEQRAHDFAMTVVQVLLESLTDDDPFEVYKTNFDLALKKFNKLFPND